MFLLEVTAMLRMMFEVLLNGTKTEREERVGGKAGYNHLGDNIPIRR